MMSLNTNQSDETESVDEHVLILTALVYGDHDSMQRLYLFWLPHIRRLAGSRGRYLSREDREEFVADVAIAVWGWMTDGRLGTLADAWQEKSFGGLICGHIARSVLRDFWRKKKSREMSEADYLRLVSGDEDESGSSGLDVAQWKEQKSEFGSVAIERAAAREFELDCLKIALQQLDEEARTLLQLRELKRLSYREIAVLLTDDEKEEENISRATSRARQKLREKFEAVCRSRGTPHDTSTR